MAFLELNYRSEALAKQVTVNVLLPELQYDEKGEYKEYKTLYLFHGLSGNRTNWIRRN